MSQLLFVRHAKVAVAGLCYGQFDIPVAVGPEEAAALVFSALGPRARTLRRVWTSPWQRTQPVAETLARLVAVSNRRPDVVVDPRLSETSMGVWEGVTFARLEAEDGARLAHWMEHWRTEGPPGGEAPLVFLQRVAAWLDEAREVVAADGDDECSLVVAHAGVARAVRALLGAPPPESATARLPEAVGRLGEALGFPVEHLRIYGLAEIVDEASAPPRPA